MVSPFAPHLGEECWDLLGNNKGGGVAFAPWVEWKEELCVSDTVTLGVQVCCPCFAVDFGRFDLFIYFLCVLCFVSYVVFYFVFFVYILYYVYFRCCWLKKMLLLLIIFVCGIGLSDW